MIDFENPDWLEFYNELTPEQKKTVANIVSYTKKSERERCAKIAEEEASGRDYQRSDANAQNNKRMARDFESMKIEAVQIASLIRSTS